MSGVFRSLSFDLAGFPYAAASAMLRKRGAKKWTTLAMLAAFSAMSVPAVTLMVSGHGLSRAVTVWSFLLGTLVIIGLNNAEARKIYRGIAASPFRSGPRKLDMGTEGVTITSPTSKWFYPWADILDVISGPNGSVMILLSPYEYEQVSATAFVDIAEQANFIAVAQAQRAAVKEQP